MATKPTHFTQMKPNARLLEQMRSIYSDYTTDEIACVIAYIRKEIEAEREEAAIDDEIAQLQARKAQLCD